MSLPGFDFNVEMEQAAIVPFVELELPLVWASGLVTVNDEMGRSAIPSVWEVPGGKFVFGFQHERKCIVFMDWPLDNYRLALVMARQVVDAAST